MKRRFAAHSLRQLCRALLLPLLLLCVQQGAFLHELSHYKPDPSQGEDQPKNSTRPCELCLAYAGVESVAGPSSAPSFLVTGLSFALMAVTTTFLRAAEVPAQRNRGPPDLL